MFSKLKKNPQNLSKNRKFAATPNILKETPENAALFSIKRIFTDYYKIINFL